MKITGLFFAWSAAIFYGIAIVYHFVAAEIVGTTALALTGGLCTIIAFYFLFTAKRIGEQPEDRLDAEVHDPRIVGRKGNRVDAIDVVVHQDQVFG